MNTPGHAVLNVALLGKKGHPERALPILLGALLPDIPIFFFFIWERLVRGVPDRLIWSERYFDPAWQRCFDVAHSIPLALAAYLIARRTYPALALLSSSLILHSLADLPLHHDDAHRHFLPFSAWRYMSPISYWDPARHGAIAALGEVVTVVIAAAVVWRRLPVQGVGRPTGTRAARTALVLVVVLYVLAYGVLYTR